MPLIAGKLTDALESQAARGRVVFKPYRTDVRVTGNDAHLGHIVEDIADVENYTLDAGSWTIEITSSAYLPQSREQDFDRKVIDAEITADTSWAALLEGAAQTPPLTPDLVTQAQTYRDEAEVFAGQAEALQDTAVETLVTTEGTATKAALSATIATEGEAGGSIVGQAAEVMGGIVPNPIRAPHLVVDDAYPKPWFGHIVLWADPSGVMYASGRDKSFLKSTNHGKTWTHQGATNAQIWHPQCFIKLATGTLVAINQAYQVIRSTDDGATWTATHSSRANTNPMGPTSWCEDQHGHIYYGEYQTADTFTAINVYRSTDDGQTFSVFHAFPGPATADANKVRHVHGVQYDPVSQRVYVMLGDSEAAAGIYRTNAETGATALEKVVSNADLAGLGVTQARAIGIMFFPDYLAWGVDGTEAPNLVRMARSEIGAASPQAQIVYRLNATAWFTTRMATDASVWLLSASKEGVTPIDKATHLYAVEDNGARVYEVGTYPQASGSSNGGLAPVGKPDLHTDRAWLQAYNLFDEAGDKKYTSVAVRLARGVQPLVMAAPPSTDPVLAWQSVSSGPLNLDVAGTFSVVIGTTRCSPSNRNRLLIYDWSVRRSSGSGVAKLQVYDVVSSAVLWETALTGTEGSKRSAISREDAAWIDEVYAPGSTRAIDFRVVTTSTFVGTAQITYGWGN